MEADGVYAFDLKVNVDFNSKHLSLGVPNQVPFSKKVYVPVSNCPPGIGYPHSPQYIPIDHEQSIRAAAYMPPRGQMMPPQQYQEVYNESPVQQHKNVESMNTTSFRL